MSYMTVRERMIRLRIIEKLQMNPELAKKIGVECAIHVRQENEKSDNNRI